MYMYQCLDIYMRVNLSVLGQNRNVNLHVLDVRKPVFGGCKQQKRRPAQSYQCLCYSLTRKYHILICYKQNFNFLAKSL